MMLHYVGEAVFDVTEAVGVLPVDNFSETKTNSPHISHQCRMKNKKHVLRHAQQRVGETVGQLHVILQQLPKNCNFENNNRRVKSQLIQNRSAC